LADNNNNIEVRKTRQQLQWQLHEIQKRIPTGYNDGEIMKELGIKKLSMKVDNFSFKTVKKERFG
jgi:hypothetical protein